MNLLEICGSIEEVEQMMVELKELGTRFNNRIKCQALSDQLIKFDLDHIFGLDIKWKKACVNKISGLHSDPGGLIQKAGKVAFTEVHEGPLGLYEAKIFLNGTVKPFSTFFPKIWDRFKVMQKIEEALGNIINIKEFETCTRVTGITSERIIIDAIIDGIERGSNKLVKVKSAFPNIEKTLEYLSI